MSLSRDLMKIAGHALKANITTLGPLVLPISEQLIFFANLVARKALRIKVGAGLVWPWLGGWVGGGGAGLGWRQRWRQRQGRGGQACIHWRLPLLAPTAAGTHPSTPAPLPPQPLCASSALLHPQMRPYIPDFKLAFEHFCIHTGGRGVIDAIERQLELGEALVAPSRESLFRYGNLSSPSIW